MHQFVRMYGPREAAGDTVAVPGGERARLGSRNSAPLGEEFREEGTHTLLGEDGFKKMVHRIASIEKSLCIFDLAQFTPK